VPVHLSRNCRDFESGQECAHNWHLPAKMNAYVGLQFAPRYGSGHASLSGGGTRSRDLGPRTRDACAAPGREKGTFYFFGREASGRSSL